MSCRRSTLLLCAVNRSVNRAARGLRDLVALGIRRGMNRFAAEWAAVVVGRQHRKATAGDFKQARTTNGSCNNEPRDTYTARDHAVAIRSRLHGVA